MTTIIIVDHRKIVSKNYQTTFLFIYINLIFHLIFLILFLFLNPACQAYGRTQTTVYPKVQPHPIGEMVCYCGTGQVVVMASDGNPMFQRSRDLSNAVHVFCAIAKNGISFACLKRAMGSFFLETHHLDNTMLGVDSKRCHTVCPGFTPSRTITDSVQCKFSPDSSHITVSSSTGFLFTVKKFKLEKVSIQCPDMMESPLSSAGAFDYSPQFPFQIISFATTQKNVHVINIETNEELLSCQTEEIVDCLLYSPDGSLLAMAFNNFDIEIYESQSLTVLHAIPMSSYCQEHVPRLHTNFPAVLSVSFSQNGEHLVSNSCDGHLRLWRIPRLFTLQELSRDAILSRLPLRKSKQLQLPTKLKDFLLYKYF